jgi:hypothetical protein
MTLKPVEVFFSYSHKDEPFREQLEVHLSMLKRQKLIKPWHDRMITAGDEWKGQIDSNLNIADIVLLLVTANFLASDYCYDIEMMRAIERHEKGEARVIPIILTPVEGWMHSPFAKLQVLPRDGKPVTKWNDRDEAFVNVVQGIRRAIESMSQAKSIAQATLVQSASVGSHHAENVTGATGGLSDRKRRRLEQERDSLQQQYDLVNEKLNRLREALAVEVDPSTKLKLEKQKEQAQSELNQIDAQLDQVEQQL